ncbi:MAG TPA: hypothetical protein P5067_01975 [Candidatus Marinimicrobia bacterium]|nr:hypothetical protein [Candidatus Neomarinimicrobiota bacterium]
MANRFNLPDGYTKTNFQRNEVEPNWFYQQDAETNLAPQDPNLSYGIKNISGWGAKSQR